MDDALCIPAASLPLEPYARKVVPRQSLRELEAQITELTGHLNAATYYWPCTARRITWRGWCGYSGARRKRRSSRGKRSSRSGEGSCGSTIRTARS